MVCLYAFHLTEASRKARRLRRRSAANLTGPWALICRRDSGTWRRIASTTGVIHTIEEEHSEPQRSSIEHS